MNVLRSYQCQTNSQKQCEIFHAIQLPTCELHISILEWAFDEFQTPMKKHENTKKSSAVLAQKFTTSLVMPLKYFDTHLLGWNFSMM